MYWISTVFLRLNPYWFCFWLRTCTPWASRIPRRGWYSGAAQCFIYPELNGISSLQTVCGCLYHSCWKVPTPVWVALHLRGPYRERTNRICLTLYEGQWYMLDVEPPEWLAEINLFVCYPKLAVFAFLISAPTKYLMTFWNLKGSHIFPTVRLDIKWNNKIQCKYTVLLRRSYNPWIRHYMFFPKYVFFPK